jgi:hypothetical protein
MAGLLAQVRFTRGFERGRKQHVDARHKAVHDERGACGLIKDRIAGVN